MHQIMSQASLLKNTHTEHAELQCRNQREKKPPIMRIAVVECNFTTKHSTNIQGRAPIIFHTMELLRLQ